MMYTILVERYAQKQLMKMNMAAISAIREAIASLAVNPRPTGCKKLKGEPAWRIRVGDYRVIYEVDDEKVTIIVITVGHRKDVYRRPY